MSSLKEQIVQRALALGFDTCRVTTAAPPASASRFQNWLADGQHGDMDYLQRNAFKRVDPDRVLPGARSVIVLATNYSNAGPCPPGAVIPVRHGQNVPQHLVPAAVPGTGDFSAVQAAHASSHAQVRDPQTGPVMRGCIARYARSADYHKILAPRLKELTSFVDDLGGPGTRSLWYVDTGPVLERDLAQRAGAGFVGKHTNLISRRLGNWLFLAEIITTLELVPDNPEKNRCGSCARCLSACPTGAITAPFQLDARRCISYLTIELKGSIPEQFRPAIGRRIFGCDDCLEVCPWNRFAQGGRIMREWARPDLAEPDLVELLGLEEAAFRSRFAGTPILRVKRSRLLRNVCVALGNVGSAETLPALAAAAQDPDPLIAEHAQWAMKQVQSRR